MKLVFRYPKLTLRQVKSIFRYMKWVFRLHHLLTTYPGNSEQLNKLKVLGHGQNLIF